MGDILTEMVPGLMVAVAMYLMFRHELKNLTTRVAELEARFQATAGPNGVISE